MLIRSVCFSIVILLGSCGNKEVLQPRPHQYPRIEFPEKGYNTYKNENCPFVIDLPAYSTVNQREYLFGDVPAGKCWFDLVLPDFNATIHCSYYPMDNRNKYDELVNDAYTMAGKHNVKATFREEFEVENNNGSKGLIFKINGPVATPYQFFISDEDQHFLRGSLYFDDQVNIDSVAPIIAFLKEDIDVLLASLKWNNIH